MASSPRLMNKNFLLLWQGQFVSQTCTQVYNLAMLFWLKSVTGSATLVGLFMALSTLPAVLLGVLGGTIADRYSRRNVIVAADLLSGVAVLALSALMRFAPGATDLTIAGFCVVAFLLGALGAVFNPAVMAAVPDIVPHERVAGANSLFQGSVQIANLSAQALAGILFRILGAPLLVLVNGISYLFAGISEMFIRLPAKAPTPEDADSPAREAGATFRRQLAEGIGYVWQRTGMRTLFLAGAALRFFIAPLTVLMPFYVADTLHAKPDWFGFLVAGFGAGVMVGYVVAGALKSRAKTTGNLLLGSMVVMALLLGSLGLIRSASGALAVLVLAGVANGFLSVKLVTILQLTTPAAMRGRVFGLLSTVSDGLTPVALLTAGLVADLTGRNIPLIYTVCGGLLALIALASLTSGELRAYVSGEQQPLD